MSSQQSDLSNFVQVPKVKQRLEDPTKAAGRLVVALVLVIIVSIAAASVLIAHFIQRQGDPTQTTTVDIGSTELIVANEFPTTGIFIIAIIALVFVAAAALSFEGIASLMSVNPRRQLLTSYRPPRDGSEVEGNLRVTILVPAHNEEDLLPQTLGALTEQLRQPDRVVVVADNCTDSTVQIALDMGVEVIESVNNVHKKAGALNQALTRLLPTADARDIFMIMDADTKLDPQFLQVGAEWLERDDELTAVGGIFYGEDGDGLVGQFQRNEYARYSLQLKARHGRVFVLTGTATMFRADALLDVAAARGVFIPGETGNVYDTAALTEDNELTLALKSLGATMVSPPQCRVTTEIMPTFKNLWVQRKRWQRGALENLSAYGITRATIRYWGQQVGIGYGAVALSLAWILFIITLLAFDTWIWFPFWLIVGGIFWLERVITAWSGGWKARILAAMLFPELAYDFFLQVVFFTCLLDIATAKRTTWGHVQQVKAGQDT